MGATIEALTRDFSWSVIEALRAVDAIAWDVEQRQCRSSSTQRLVLFASGAPIAERKCCVLYALLAARWYAFLRDDEKEGTIRATYRT